MSNYLKKIILFLFLLAGKILLAANDSIAKVNRVIPENFKERYTSSKYTYTEQEPGFLFTIKKWFNDLLISILEKIGFNIHKNYEYITYLKLGFYFIIITIAIYIIARIFFYKEGQWIFRKNRRQNNFAYQDEVEIIEVSNFEKLIQKASQQKDYRLAIKYYYFWVLQKLAEKEIIELSNLKTNADYQLEVEDTTYHQSFNSVSYYYNYIWYGEFDIDEITYQKIEPIFNELLNTIK